MLLFHYSKEKYNTLLTLEKQRVITKEEREKEEREFVEYSKKAGYMRPGYYFEHISFFFEPPPLDIMSTIFPADHSAWCKGAVLYEHVIDTNDLKGFQYEVVESPEKTNIYYDDDLTIPQYYRLLKQLNENNKYIGKSNKDLEEIGQRFIGTTTEFFKQIKDRPNYDEIKYKYAATVPHVMLYPHLGQIKPKKISKVKVQ